MITVCLIDSFRFVTLVRSRTPKIILYTPDAKCLLMETGIDFEVVFLSGLKMTICRENWKMDEPLRIKIVNQKEKSESLLDYDRVTASNRSAIEHFSPEIRQMLDQTVLVRDEEKACSTSISKCFSLVL